MKEYSTLIQGIIKGVGGVDNIENCVHCATRLRFTLKDSNKFDENALKNVNGVLGTMIGSGLYQVLIGTNVGDVYAQLMDTPELREKGLKVSKEVPGDDIVSEKKIGLLDRFSRLMSDVYAPYIPILATGGIASGIIGVLANLGIVDTTGLTYQVFYAIFYALIYFFPILLALFFMSYFERVLKKYLPEITQFILVPLLCLVVFVPLTILVFGPAGGMIANAIKVVYNMICTNKILVGIVFGAFFSLIILLGMHWAITPILLAVMAEQGFEPALAAGGMGNYAALGICLAVALFAKNTSDKATAGSAAFTNALCGITEPGLYGIILRNKWLIGVMVMSGAVGGLVLGIGGVAATNFSFSGILAFSGWLGCINFPMYCFGIVVSILIGFGATAFLLKSGKVKQFD